MIGKKTETIARCNNCYSYKQSGVNLNKVAEIVLQQVYHWYQQVCGMLAQSNLKRATGLKMNQ